ncbi:MULTISPECIES: 8-amino-7-oxononanoate synthase [unclassified Chelatococcus]|uniref:8-amino-7-oxononanoate synthase n=1 Tax=unclassified Chelatococcus TaxID=2638111 RepID=UPI001BCFC194|nr:MULTISPECIES: 8-amino-7-oxononanoate synthase [unclassified Chelatococcus]MBS7699580.1 8-amino-7-oxononanoate synthase [Chelatococcus sp. YT9]MBX3557220.1 8-amino-7-oxononanoate synthase [Chelatococcus sp.]
MNRKSLLDRYEVSLSGLARKSRLRSLSRRTGLDFASNDYLALATSAHIAAAIVTAVANGTPAGATGSRLLRGNANEHEALEAKAAGFFGSERALFFGGGYLANFAVLTTLPQKGDLVVLDALMHASAHEGARAGRADVVKVPHRDADAVDDAINTWRASGGRGHAWIVAESLYSMDGDRAPLDELAAIADRREAFLFIDEAHATGVYGPRGRGLAHHLEGRENVVVLHTCGKALGACGALVTAPRVLCDYLVNRCRPFIYATAPSPLMAVAATAALDIVAAEQERRERLANMVITASEQAEAFGFKTSGSQIMPIIIGDNIRVMALAEALQARNFDVRGIRPPTVPEGTARLRISLTLNVEEPDLLALFEALSEECSR